MENLSKEMETVAKKQTEVLNLKNSRSELSSLAMLNSWMEMTEALLEKSNRNYPIWKREKIEEKMNRELQESLR